MGRSARGVRALNLKADQSVIAMLICTVDRQGGKVLVATENGYGKRTDFGEFSSQESGWSGRYRN